MLIFFSKALVGLCGGGEWVGRVGPAQFVVFLPGVGSKEGVLQYARSVVQLFLSVEQIDLAGLDLSCDIGISLYPQDGFNYSDLAYNADKALYYAKRQGKNRIVFYSEVNGK